MHLGERLYHWWHSGISRLLIISSIEKNQDSIVAVLSPVGCIVWKPSTAPWCRSEELLVFPSHALLQAWDILLEACDCGKSPLIWNSSQSSLDRAQSKSGDSTAHPHNMRACDQADRPHLTLRPRKTCQLPWCVRGGRSEQLGMYVAIIVIAA